jgi:cell division cycle 14
MGVFMVVILQRTPEEAWEVLKDYHHSITPFRDATAGICTYNLTILEVLKGLEKAMELGWYNFKTFDVQEYEYYEKLDNGDLNWVIPGKICAFMGP